MKITFLGTNGWYDSATGNTIAILVETQEYDIVLDAGNGLFKLDEYISCTKPAYLFLSHFHLDHIEGLHILGKFRFERGLVLCGPDGSTGVLNTIVSQPFSMPLAHLPYRTEIRELPRDLDMIPFTVQALPLLHSSLTLGYRFTIDGKTIAYVPDTGYCDNALALGANADQLITECAYRPGESTPSWPHLNPEIAARIAREAGARRLCLVHFDASRYTTMDDRKRAESVARNTFGQTVAAIDGMRIEL